MSFRFQELEIPEIILIEAPVFEDSRGLFMETYKRSEFEANGIPPVFVQNNYSHSVQGVLRGLHYQKHPKAQGKLVKVIRGEIFDAAVDIRSGSPSYGRSICVILSAQNRHMVYVPPGFAHGFCVLSDEADVVYDVTEEYAPEMERGIIWNDPELGIPWPTQTPYLSPKDVSYPSLREVDNNFTYRGLPR
jgi:dTDP-4-dehydrorhamnose 3,5-epimerase